jgi:hypothetical protein
MSFVPKDITTLSTVLSNTLDLASFIVSSIFSKGNDFVDLIGTTYLSNLKTQFTRTEG